MLSWGHLSAPGGHDWGRPLDPWKFRDAELPRVARESWAGVSVLPCGSSPHISTVSTSVGHQPWISQVRSSAL